jgi:hypothetical protein
MSNGEQQKTPTTGRTINDLFAEIAARLGVPILILIGVVFAMYMFVEQSQKGRLEQQKQLEKAHEALRETYVAISTMHGAMLENVQGGVATLTDLQARLREVQDQEELAAQRTQEALAAKRNAEEELQKVQEKKEQIVNENKEKQQLRAERLGKFGEEVQKLVDEIVKERETNNPNITALAQKIQADYLIDPVETLAKFKKEGASESVLADLERFEGLSLSQLDKIAKENKMEFKLWLAHGEFVIGIVEPEEQLVHGFVVFTTSEDRVYDVEAYDSIQLLTSPSVTNWDQRTALVVATAKGKYDLTDLERPIDDGLTMSSFMGLTSELPGKPKVLSGVDLRMPTVTIENLLSSNRVLAAVLRRESQIFHKLASMLDRADSFSASVLIPPGRFSPSLRDAVVKTINAAVKRNNEQRVDLAGDRSIAWGELAAIALQPSFNLNDFSVKDSDATIVFQAKEEFGEVNSIRVAMSRSLSGIWELTGVASVSGFLTPVPVPGVSMSD